MSQKNLSFTQLLDLIEMEFNRGIIDKDEFLRVFKESGAIPKMINDTRGALRLAIAREGDAFSVTTHPTDLANESIGEIYPIANNKAANDNGIGDTLEQAA